MPLVGAAPRRTQRWGGAGTGRKKVSIDLIPNTRGLRLVARTERVDADIQIDRPDGHESMGSSFRGTTSSSSTP